MIDREAIAAHLYRRGAWTLDVCRKVADEIAALTSEGEGAVPVGRDDGEIDPRIDAAYLAIQQKAPHLITAGFCLSHAYEVAKAVLEANDRAARHPTRQDGAKGDAP